MESSNFKNDEIREDEQYTNHSKKLSIKKIFQASKSICKIIEEDKENTEAFATGFFMYIYKENKKYECLLTNNHVIDEKLINNKSKIKIEIHNNSKYQIDLVASNRFIKCFKKPIDITIIQIIDSDIFKKDIDFFYYDLNYIIGYEQYLNMDIFIIQHPLGREAEYVCGKITKIFNNFEFEHTVDTDFGSSGSPIISNESLKVIGIHKQRYKYNNYNIGTFIGEIFKEEVKNETKETDEIIMKKMQEDNKNDIILENKTSQEKDMIKSLNKLINAEKDKSQIKELEKINIYEKTEKLSDVQKHRLKDIDIVFMVDSTGSMDDIIFMLNKYCINIWNILENKIPGISLKFGWIFYRDPIDSTHDKHDYIDLTDNINTFKHFVSTIQAYGGGDTPEDWIGSYNIALNNINWRKGLRCIIHITDSGAHGTKYSPSDGHPDQGPKLDLLIPKCASNDFQIIAFNVGVGRESLKSFNEFKRLFLMSGGKQYIIKEFDRDNDIDKFFSDLIVNNIYDTYNIYCCDI